MVTTIIVRHLLRLCIAVAAVAVVVFAGTASTCSALSTTTTWYVNASAAGNSANCSTPVSPCRDVSYVLRQLAFPGDTIYLTPETHIVGDVFADANMLPNITFALWPSIVATGSSGRATLSANSTTDYVYTQLWMNCTATTPSTNGSTTNTTALTLKLSDNSTVSPHTYWVFDRVDLLRLHMIRGVDCGVPVQQMGGTVSTAIVFRRSACPIRTIFFGGVADVLWVEDSVGLDLSTWSFLDFTYRTLQVQQLSMLHIMNSTFSVRRVGTAPSTPDFPLSYLSVGKQSAVSLVSLTVSRGLAQIVGGSTMWQSAVTVVNTSLTIAEASTVVGGQFVATNATNLILRDVTVTSSASISLDTQTQRLDISGSVVTAVIYVTPPTPGQQQPAVLAVTLTNNVFAAPLSTGTVMSVTGARSFVMIGNTFQGTVVYMIDVGADAVQVMDNLVLWRLILRRGTGCVQPMANAASPVMALAAASVDIQPAFPHMLITAFAADGMSAGGAGNITLFDGCGAAVTTAYIPILNGTSTSQIAKMDMVLSALPGAPRIVRVPYCDTTCIPRLIGALLPPSVCTTPPPSMDDGSSSAQWQCVDGAWRGANITTGCDGTSLCVLRTDNQTVSASSAQPLIVPSNATVQGTIHLSIINNTIAAAPTALMSVGGCLNAAGAQIVITTDNDTTIHGASLLSYTTACSNATLDAVTVRTPDRPNCRRAASVAPQHGVDGRTNLMLVFDPITSPFICDDGATTTAPSSGDNMSNSLSLGQVIGVSVGTIVSATVLVVVIVAAVPSLRRRVFPYQARRQQAPPPHQQELDSLGDVGGVSAHTVWAPGHV